MIAADYIENKEQNAISIDRIIEMAWEDRTPFEAIEYQFGLAEKEVIKLMRNQLKLNSFNLWRKRVNSKISQKHLKKRRNLPLQMLETTSNKLK